MGIDQDELLKLSAAVSFAVITRPSRLEVDLLKSFVDVDIDFLDGPDAKWLD